MSFSLTTAYFNKFSLGGPTITPDQFAKIILHHTSFDMQRVQSKLQASFNPSTEHVSH